MNETVNSVDIQTIDAKIRSLKETAQELIQIFEGLPFLSRNTTRILATIQMLEINLCDVVALGISAQNQNPSTD